MLTDVTLRGIPGAAVVVTQPEDVGTARRRAREFARTVGLDALQAEDAALVATELATNLLKHAGRGQLWIQPGPHAQLELLAIDGGPGIADLDRAFRDGESTHGTGGLGLGAVQRKSRGVTVHSVPGSGTVLRARLGTEGSGVAALLVPKDGHAACGDGWLVRREEHRALIVVVDGLGHGQPAAEATAVALDAASACALDAVAAMEAMHTALAADHALRGAVAFAFLLDGRAATASGVGVGNITAAVVRADKVDRVPSVNGTLGRRHRTLHPHIHALHPSAVVLLHSDGLSARWNLDGHNSQALRDTWLLGGLLMRDVGRTSDDRVLVAARAGDLALMDAGGRR